MRTGDRKQHCDVLGVGEDASLKDIKKAFRRAVKRFHPDSRNPEQDAEAKLQRVLYAYRALTSEDTNHKPRSIDQAFAASGGAHPYRSEYARRELPVFELPPQTVFVIAGALAAAAVLLVPLVFAILSMPFPAALPFDPSLEDSQILLVSVFLISHMAGAAASAAGGFTDETEGWFGRSAAAGAAFGAVACISGASRTLIAESGGVAQVPAMLLTASVPGALSGSAMLRAMRNAGYSIGVSGHPSPAVSRLATATVGALQVGAALAALLVAGFVLVLILSIF